MDKGWQAEDGDANPDARHPPLPWAAPPPPIQWAPPAPPPPPPASPPHQPPAPTPPPGVAFTPAPPPPFDPDALFASPKPAGTYVQPRPDKVTFTPGLIVAIVLVLALLAGGAVWAFGQSTSTPAALPPLKGTLPTIPIEIPTTTAPPPLGATPAMPQVTAPPPPPADTPGGWANQSIAGMTFDVPVDCHPTSASSIAGSLGSAATVQFLCSSTSPSRVVLIATMDGVTGQFDGSDQERAEFTRGVTDALAGRGAEISTEAHQVFGKPGVLVHIKLMQGSVPVYETGAVGNGPSGLVLIIVGQAYTPWDEGTRVIDSAR